MRRRWTVVMRRTLSKDCVSTVQQGMKERKNSKDIRGQEEEGKGEGGHGEEDVGPVHHGHDDHDEAAEREGDAWRFLAVVGE